MIRFIIIHSSKSVIVSACVIDSKVIIDSEEKSIIKLLWESIKKSRKSITNSSLITLSFLVDFQGFIGFNQNMSETKMLKAILDGQRAIKEELKKDIKKVDKKVDKGFRGVNKRIDETNKRLDKIGKSVAFLEEDAPTIEEFDNLEKRVSKVEKQVASA